MLAAVPLIAELMAKNTATLQDEDGDFPDWIEISNPTLGAVPLSGWYLTDDDSDLGRWTFPEVTLEAGHQLLVFASGKDRRDPDAVLHTNFKLDDGGEYLALVRPDLTIASSFAPTYPALQPDISYGVNAAGDGAYFSPATPGQVNGEGFENEAGTPRVSLAPGTYVGAQQVAISSGDPAASLHYTTNGAEPTLADPLYTEPLEITASTLLRVRAFEESKLPGPIVSHSYIMLAPELAGRESNLPLVIIDTMGDRIPPSESTRFASAVTTLIDATEGAPARLASVPDFIGRGGLRVRGSSSTAWPKQSYSFETWDASGNDLDVGVLGFPADSDWVLFASYLDRTLLRDSLVHELSRQMGRYSVRTRPVELYLNVGRDSVNENDYRGVYLLMERIKRSPDRVDIAALNRNENSEPEISGGYLLKIDRGSATIPATLSRDLILVAPDPTEITPPQRAWITEYIAEFEAALSGPEFADPETGYAKYIDVDAWIDYHIMTELTYNVDEWYLSTYLYKDRGGKLILGPFWDFDRSLGNTNQIGGEGTTGWYSDAITTFFAAYNGVPASQVVEYPWFRQLFADPNFAQHYIDRWHELRQTVLADDHVLRQIDTMVAELGEAQVRNFQRWRILNSNIAPSPLAFASHDEHVADLKRWMVERMAWIDRQFPVAPVLDPAEGRVPGDGQVQLFVPGPDSFAEVTFVAEDAAVRLLIPTDDTLGIDWTATSFDDTTWAIGLNGVGYEQVPTSSPNFLDLIGTEVPAGTTSTYQRFAFDIEDPTAVDRLLLRMRYDDGFVAYLNGHRVASANAPAVPAFDSSATAAHADGEAIEFQEFEISDYRMLLVEGSNLLALQGLNAGSSSPDFLTQAWLVGATRLPNVPLDLPIYYTLDGTDPRSPNTPSDGNVLLAPGAAATALVPTMDIGNSWRERMFDDSGWQRGSSGIGFEKTPAASLNYEPLIGLDIQSQIDPITGGANEFKSVYVRLPFQYDGSAFEQLVLRMKYDDGFVAYLNGIEIARANVAAEAGWDAMATRPHADNEAVVFQDFDVSEFRRHLIVGQNVLAIHGFNSGIVDSDMLLLPELIGQTHAAGISPAARRYTDPIHLSGDTHLIARALADGRWSASTSGVYLTDGLPLRITEIMYHPSDVTAMETAAGAADANDFEYLELTNVSSSLTLDLEGLQFLSGIEFAFPAFSLAPGQRVFLVNDEWAFRLRYGAEPLVLGQYRGNLSNGGESVWLADRTGSTIQRVDYSDRDPWPVSADGGGASLQMIDPLGTPAAEAGRPDRWTALPSSLGSFLHGDVNGDGQIDEGDIQALCVDLRLGEAQSDLNGDGNVDRKDLTFLIDDILGTSAGDADLDGTFSSDDLVRVLQAGEYEDQAFDNSTWSEGDWNCDDEFDSSDLVLAFQTGRFELAVNSVSDRSSVAIDWLFTHATRRTKQRPFVA